MKKIVTIAALTVSLGASACSGGASGDKSLGCLTDLGDAENTYNSGVTGIGTTTTVSDAEKALASIKSKLDDLVVVNTDSTIKAKATDASTRAGKIRVALTDGGGVAAVEVSDVSALKADFTALEAQCTANSK